MSEPASNWSPQRLICIKLFMGIRLATHSTSISLQSPGSGHWAGFGRGEEDLGLLGWDNGVACDKLGKDTALECK